MQPDTTVKFDRASFERIRKNVSGIMTAVRGRKKTADYGSPVPLDIGVELTTRCNLHCRHCFLWNEDGFYRQEQGFEHKDLPFHIVEKVLRETSSQKSNLFFWGTEPLMYPQWEELSQLLEKDHRWTVVCTNGMLIDKKIESILRISENLALVLSMDGPQDAHDEMRGTGAFARLMRNVNLVLEMKKQGKYHGLVTLHTVLSEKLIPDLFDYCRFVETLGVDSLYIGFPWYIGLETAKKMDRFVAENYDIINMESTAGKRPSWHTYIHTIDMQLVPELKKQMEKITKMAWNFRLRFQPALELHEIEDFLSGGEKPAQGRTECYAVSNRMDIRADGTVTSCQCYPELVVGNLTCESVAEIWHGEKIKKIRRTVAQNLPPVCSKCILLYLNGK
jgi:radical SAM protein with 4Fe4S-binding SPASM domain